MKKPIINLPLQEHSTTFGLLEKLDFQLLKRTPGFDLFTDGSILIRLEKNNEFGKALILRSDEKAGQQFTDPAEVSVHWKPGTWFENTLKEIPNIEAGHSPCGRFYEVSIGVADEDYKPTIIFWQKQDFELVENDPDQHGYVTLQWQEFKLSVYKRKQCPHLFNSPALTYFEPNMADRIRQLKAKGITLAQELTNSKGKVDNAILETDEGVHFFLFAY